MAKITMLKPLAVSALALGCFGGIAAQAADIPASYDYPYKDPWLATASVALLTDPKLPEKQVKDETLIPARMRTPLFEDKARVYYVTYRQEQPADLVVLISGLGSVAEDPLALYLGGQLFAMGYNVIVVPDAFNWQFALGASSTGYVGIPSTDAADLERFIVRARDHAVRVDGMKVRETKLVGYSMGALEGAFLAAREAQHPRLRFDKVVLINPPVDTFYDLRVLDGLSDTGRNWSAEEKKTTKAKAFALVKDARLSDPQGAPYFRDLEQRNTLTDDQLKFVLFGLFRDSLRDVVMVTQQIRDLGILKTPADKTHLDAREEEAAQFGFEDYLNQFIKPSLGLPRDVVDQRLKGETLYGLHDFLASHHEVEVFHNADDFLVRPQDIAYLRSTLGARLTLFPHGGHMGNIWAPENQQMLKQALGRGPVPDAPAAPAIAVAAPVVPPVAGPSLETQPAEAQAIANPAPATTAAADQPAAPASSAGAQTPAPADPAAVPAAPIPAAAASSAPGMGAAPMPAPEAVPVAATPSVPSPQPEAAGAATPSAPSPPTTPVPATVAAEPAPSAPAPVQPPVTAVVAPPAPDRPAPPSGVGTTTTTVTTTTGPSSSPTYTISIPQIPEATPSVPAASDAHPP
jgi:hypothetical protein